ncbi:MAG: hypothetical protein V1702_02985 [Candidatus Woesearchaeota archaeon]
MGRLLRTKSLASGKVKCFLEVCPDEVLSLEGSLRDVYVFSAGFCKTKAGFVEMGINDSTKYFEVPEGMVIKHGAKRVKSADRLGVSCQTLEDESKIFFIYIVNRA